MAKEVMSQDLVKCPCCEKLVPSIDMELSYRMPDAISSMADDEIEAQCHCTNDYVVCEEEYFYIRCVLSLPVQDTGRDYGLGVWVQVSPKSFNRIWELWDDEEQSKEPPMRGLLANDVHLNTGTENAEVEVQLTGPTSRPMVTVTDPECTLYHEQQSGITVHRASEYSNLCR